MHDPAPTEDEALAVPIGVRIRNAGVGVLGATIVAWLAWPLIGLLSTYLRLPPDFEPLAMLLLLAMIGMAGVAGWFYSASDGTPASSADPQRRQ